MSRSRSNKEGRLCELVRSSSGSTQPPSTRQGHLSRAANQTQPRIATTRALLAPKFPIELPRRLRVELSPPSPLPLPLGCPSTRRLYLARTQPRIRVISNRPPMSEPSRHLRRLRRSFLIKESRSTPSSHRTTEASRCCSAWAGRVQVRVWVSLETVSFFFSSLLSNSCPVPSKSTSSLLRPRLSSGRTQPIPMVVSTPGLGIGKLSQDTRVLDEVVGKGRREMESERWAGLSESERGKGVVSLVPPSSFSLSLGEQS